MGKITEVLESWPSVVAITHLPFSEDVYDPYFFITLDVYYTESIPEAEHRANVFDFTGGFETSGFNRKDRFLIGDIPFRLEYKDTHRFDEILNKWSSDARSLRDSGTYVFFRLINAEVLIDRSPWLGEVKAKLEQLPQAFWSVARNSAQVSMEHYLGDLSAAVLRQDLLFFQLSFAGFLKSALRTIFAVNKVFEPSLRHLWAQSKNLEILPDSFDGHMESLLREQNSSISQKREIAQLLAKRIIQL